MTLLLTRPVIPAQAVMKFPLTRPVIPAQAVKKLLLTRPVIPAQAVKKLLLTRPVIPAQAGIQEDWSLLHSTESTITNGLPRYARNNEIFLGRMGLIPQID